LRWPAASSEGRISPNFHPALNLRCIREDPFVGLQNLLPFCWIGALAMPKVVRFPQSISTPSVSSDKAQAQRQAQRSARRSEYDAFVSVALFSAIGLLISLVAILLGLPGAWY
jgi:hypothetical protein